MLTMTRSTVLLAAAQASPAPPRTRSHSPRPEAPPRRTLDALTGLSIVLPCLNEEANVATAIQEALIVGGMCALQHEGIVVDDGSSDGTARVVSAIAERNPRVRLVVHARNRGCGAAVSSGIDTARITGVRLTDADIQFDLLELQRFLVPALDADLIIGRRVE